MVATPPIFSLLLQNPSGHTGMLLEHVVDTILQQNGDNILSYPDPGIEYSGRSPKNVSILNTRNSLS